MIQNIVEHLDELVKMRHYLHSHPELGFQEHTASKLIAERLSEWGIPFSGGVAGTGVVATVRRGTGKRSIGLRADMDALPIPEAGEPSYRSKIAGQMHACGHDGHTTMLLGAARYLSVHGSFDGTVHLFFQPAEETLLGATAMLAAGILEQFPCDAIYALHNRPGLSIGSFSVRSGVMMAGGANFEIALEGKGAHGARPEESVDPILAACQVVSALQSIVSRNVSPFQTAVVSVTAINGGQGYNTIPGAVLIRGTLRTLNDETMKFMQERISTIATKVAEGLGVKAALEYKAMVPPLSNSEREAGVFGDAAADIVGEAKVNRNAPALMSSEDFSFILQQRPGAYMNVGNGPSAGLHNPDYDFNDEALPFGVAVLARVAERELPVLA